MTRSLLALSLPHLAIPLLRHHASALTTLIAVAAPILAPDAANRMLALAAAAATLLAAAALAVTARERRATAATAAAAAPRLAPDHLSLLNAPRLPALVQLRAIVALQTVFCILAVDFSAVFPAEHAKTTSLGAGGVLVYQSPSVMDFGTAGIVLTGALVRRTRSGGGGGAGRARRTVTLVALGALRALAITLFGVGAPESEMGRHWNFFLTLACVHEAVPRLAPTSAVRALGLGLAILCAHQLALSHGGLARIVADAPREGLVSANKEGLISLPGYVALALVGDALGSLFRRQPTLHGWLNVCQRVAAASALSWVATFAAASLWQPPCARLCNLSYALWSVALILLLALLCVIGSLVSKPPPPRDLCAVNSSPLTVFVAANLLTGAINLLIETKSVGGGLSLAVLTAYMTAVLRVPYLCAWCKPQ